MTPVEMESLLIDVDRRTRRIEDRFESMGERVRHIDERTSRIEQILPTLATKDDLGARFDEARREARVLHEDLRSSISLLAEHVTGLYDRLDRNRQ